MTPDELVEKVAAAIWERAYPDHLWNGDYVGAPLYRAAARAALRVVHEALEEPGELMVAAAYRTEGHSRAAAAIWRAMLAASPLGRIDA